MPQPFYPDMNMTMPFITRRSLLAFAAAFPAASMFPIRSYGNTGVPSSQLLSSEEVSKLFIRFAEERRMPPELGRWLGNKSIQEISPYKVFDNVWCVGICWVSAYAIRTKDGVILIDTLHEPFVDKLLSNLREVGIDLSEIKYVLMTHGHFDHVGGAWRLRELLPHARFGMSARGWAEAKGHEKERNGFRMPPADLILKDGDKIALGETIVTVLETPGHTWGTCSYLYDVRDGDEMRRAVTIGGQGLNAMDDLKQLEAYIGSMRRLGDPALDIDVDLTAHPFSTGQKEKIPAIRAHRHGEPHPLVDRNAYLERLERLIAGAERYRRQGARA